MYPESLISVACSGADLSFPAANQPLAPKARSLSDRDRSAAIDRLYDVALDPARYEALVDTWEAAIAPLRAEAAEATPFILNDPQIEAHFQRAHDVMERMTITAQRPPEDELRQILLPFGKVAAFVTDPHMTLRAANTAAGLCFGLHAGMALTSLPLEAEEAPIVRRSVMNLLPQSHGASTTLRLRGRDTGQFIVMRLLRLQDQSGQPLVLITCSEMGWPEGFSDLLQGAFDLTRAESEIVRGLVECGSVNDLAAARGRSVGTVRAQVKSILAKTEARSQVELVRLALSVMDMADYTPSVPQAPRVVSEGDGGLEPLEFQSLITADGRRLDYLTLGDPAGQPMLYLPQAYGLNRWPARAEAAAKARSWKVLTPVRAGCGYSDPFPKGADVDGLVVADCLAILDKESVANCPVLSFGDDSYYAIKLANAAPTRIRAIMACAGVLPLTEKAQFERMEKWHRFIMAGAKYTPHLLPFMVKAGFLLARKIGKHGFVHAIFGKSPADVETFETPEVFEAMMAGSETVLSDRHLAHDSFARCLLGGFLTDWSADVRALEGQLPVVFINGAEDPQVPQETLRDFARAYPWIRFDLHSDAGQLVFFKHWQNVMEEFSKFMPEKPPHTPSGI